MGSRIAIAMAVLVRDGRVLMVHRQPGRRAYPDRWALPGGHVELRWCSPAELAELNLAHPETLPNIVDAIRAAGEIVTG